MSKRDERIDNLRALAILFVVFGHSIILYSSSWDLYETERWADSMLCTVFDITKNWINFIQMPLFFSISGFLFRTNKDLKSLILSKSIRLLVPYVCIGALWMIPIKCLVGYEYYADKDYIHILYYFLRYADDQGHLWFLPCLILCFLLGHFWNRYGLGRLTEKGKFLPALLLTLGLMAALRIGCRIVPSSLLINLTQWFFYFELGYFLKQFDLLGRLKKYRLLLILGSAALSVISLTGLLPVSKLTSVVLVVTLYEVIPGKTTKFTDILSRESFGIYLFHSPLIYITFAFWREMHPIIVVSMNFLVFGALSLLMSMGISRTGLRFMIGQHKKG